MYLGVFLYNLGGLRRGLHFLERKNVYNYIFWNKKVGIIDVLQYSKGMDRQLFTHLEAWKGKGKRKPLILMGARQVGKTFLLQQFAREKYHSYVYLNFEDTPSLKKLFEESLQPKDIIRNISIESNTKIHPEETLLIFDEVQECPNALNSLKYLHDFANVYHI